MSAAPNARAGHGARPPPTPPPPHGHLCPFFVPKGRPKSRDNAQVLLVGNKCDMEDERVVSAEKGRQLAEHLGERGGSPCQLRAHTAPCPYSSVPIQRRVGRGAPVVGGGCMQV